MGKNNSRTQQKSKQARAEEKVMMLLFGRRFHQTSHIRSNNGRKHRERV